MSPSAVIDTHAAIWYLIADSIAATAVHFGVPVISRDGKIRTSSVSTIW